MSKLFCLEKLLLPLFGAIVFFALACNESVDKTPAVAEPVQKAAIGNYMDTLWIDSASFAKLNSTLRTVFLFKVGGLDTLTLAGWSAPGQTSAPFLNDPDIVLLKGRAATTVPLGQGTYLGNQVLHKEQLKHVQDLLNTNHGKYVLFAPGIYLGHVMYSILIGFDDPKAGITPYKYTTPPVNSNTQTNPSPPKSYTN